LPEARRKRRRGATLRILLARGVGKRVERKVELEGKKQTPNVEI